MKINYYLSGFILYIFLLGKISAQERNVPEEYKFNANSAPSEVAGETRTLFTQKESNVQKKSCTLLQNKWKNREIIHKKDGYKIITSGNDEIVDVKKRKNGITRISYVNDYETLVYKVLKSGKVIYKYSYSNGCVTIKSNKNKKGITSNTNKSNIPFEEINENINRAVDYAVNSCANI